MVPYSPTQILTHRVVEVSRDGDICTFRTKGDANPNPDRWDITPREILGKGVAIIPRLGHILYMVKANLAGIALTTLGIGLLLMNMGGARRDSGPTSTPKREPDRQPLPEKTP
ncbi:hypothetical protein KEJ23_07685 [Candidatus Bathyarchaeota archaeon]|nr:hypothetical protein [Candidatus Bathyarchaeota archaeon]